MTPIRPPRFLATRFGIIAATVAGFAIGAAGFAAAQHDDPAPAAASSDDASTTIQVSTTVDDTPAITIDDDRPGTTIDLTIPDPVDDGPSTTIDDGPSTTIDDGPSTTIDDGPSTTIDDGPSTTIDDGPSTTVDDGPSTTIDDGPSTTVDDGPRTTDRRRTQHHRRRRTQHHRRRRTQHHRRRRTQHHRRRRTQHHRRRRTQHHDRQQPAGAIHDVILVGGRLDQRHVERGCVHARLGVASDRIPRRDRGPGVGPSARRLRRRRCRCTDRGPDQRRPVAGQDRLRVVEAPPRSSRKHTPCSRDAPGDAGYPRRFRTVSMWQPTRTSATVSCADAAATEAQTCLPQ